MSVARCLKRLGSIACAILLLCPVLGFSESAGANAAPVSQDQVLVPNSAVAAHPTAGKASSSSGPLTLVGVLALAGAGGWMLWRARSNGVVGLNRATRNLAVEETRALGNRQFLVVASYQDKKFLIGVCPGRIDLLSALNSSDPVATEKSRS
jgi:flagellar protein FliO/FliZ